MPGQEQEIENKLKEEAAKLSGLQPAMFGKQPGLQQRICALEEAKRSFKDRLKEEIDQNGAYHTDFAYSMNSQLEAIRAFVGMSG